MLEILSSTRKKSKIGCYNAWVLKLMFLNAQNSLRNLPVLTLEAGELLEARMLLQEALADSSKRKFVR